MRFTPFSHPREPGHAHPLLHTSVVHGTNALGQGRFTSLMNSLEAAIVDQPGLDGTVELSVSGTPVTEFVRGLGVTHQLNITIDPAVKGEVVNNFTDARVVDVLMFLCKRYDLDVEFIGSIHRCTETLGVPVAPPEAATTSAAHPVHHLRCRQRLGGHGPAARHTGCRCPHHQPDHRCQRGACPRSGEQAGVGLHSRASPCRAPWRSWPSPTA